LRGGVEATNRSWWYPFPALALGAACLFIAGYAEWTRSEDESRALQRYGIVMAAVCIAVAVHLWMSYDAIEVRPDDKSAQWKRCRGLRRRVVRCGLEQLRLSPCEVRARRRYGEVVRAGVVLTCEERAVMLLMVGGAGEGTGEYLAELPQEVRGLVAERRYIVSVRTL
jgi:hypothetical protein